jgi:hypothetical protein
VADGWCWFVLREKYYWLVADGGFVLREKYCWLVADKTNEQPRTPTSHPITISIRKHKGKLIKAPRDLLDVAQK